MSMLKKLSQIKANKTHLALPVSVNGQIMRPRFEVTIAESNGSQSLVGVEDDGSADILLSEFIDNLSFDIIATLLFFKNDMMGGSLG